MSVALVKDMEVWLDGKKIEGVISVTIERDVSVEIQPDWSVIEKREVITRTFDTGTSRDED